MLIQKPIYKLTHVCTHNNLITGLNTHTKQPI